jgi:5-formyltetrahydrofolate cyclo-ligase
MTKEALRKIYLDKRMSLSEAAFSELSRKVADNFFALADLSFIRVLHTFLPIRKTNEPDTWVIVDRIRREFPNVRIAIPKINNQTSQLDNFYFEGLHQLENNTWGIPEPKQGIPVPTEKIDAALVPLLAFDKSGHRVGYGRGFYDKFLSTCRPDCKRIGLSYFAAVDSISNVHPQDLPLDMVVTPDGIITFPAA